MRSLIAETEEHLIRTAELLNAVIKDIGAGKFGQAKELTGILSSLEKALQAAFHERMRVEKLRNSTGGAAGAGALDFDAARAEIGRRLARLRDAGDG
ncbi:MAG: hypothetical protein R3D84_13470 [Paracoccaceae bacterium]